MTENAAQDATDDADADADAEDTDDDGAEPAADRPVCWRAGRIGFAPFDVQDAELLHRWRSDPVAAHEFGYWPRPLSYVREKVEQDRDDDSRDDFLIVLSDGTPVGRISLVDTDLIAGTAEVCLLLDAGHRGRGLGTAALDAMTDFAFGELPLARLEAVTHTANAAALAVLAASGFVLEGVRRSACVHRGRRYDEATLSLLRAEWEALDRPRAWDRAEERGEPAAADGLPRG